MDDERVLPPTMSSAAHVPGGRKPGLSAQVKRPKRTLPSLRNAEEAKLRSLRQRAKRAYQGTHKHWVPLTSIRVDVSTYEALVTLSERWELPISRVARECITDGLKRFEDFDPKFGGAFSRAKDHDADDFIEAVREEVLSPKTEDAEVYREMVTQQDELKTLHLSGALRGKMPPTTKTWSIPEEDSPPSPMLDD